MHCKVAISFVPSYPILKGAISRQILNVLTNIQFLIKYS